MVRRSACVTFLQQKVVLLVGRACKDERHGNYERACDIYEDALFKLAQAIYHHAENRDCQSRAQIRENLAIFENFIKATSIKRREYRAMLRKRFGNNRNLLIIATFELEQLKGHQENLLEIFKVTPSHLRRIDREKFCDLMEEDYVDLEDSMFDVFKDRLTAKQRRERDDRADMPPPLPPKTKGRVPPIHPL